jgi:hypothetical protein
MLRWRGRLRGGRRVVVTPKIAVLIGADDLYVFTTKRDGSAAVLCRMVRGVVSSSSSLGVSGEFWRRTQTRNVLGAWVRQITASATSGTWNTASVVLVDHHPDATAGTQLTYDRTTTNGDYKEYTITVGPEGRFTLGFLKSGTSSLSATVSIPADVGFTPQEFSTRRSGATNEIEEREFSYQPGECVVRVTHTGVTGAPLYLLGANFRSILSANQFDPGNSGFDSYAWVRDAKEYVSVDGANDYAIYSKTAALWGGSYHGGETATSTPAMKVNGVAVTLSTGVPVMGSEFSIEQATEIAWATETIATQSTTKFIANGEMSLDVSMSGSVVCEKFIAGMNSSYATQSAGVFTGGFSEMTEPESETFSAEGEHPQAISTRYVQLNPATGQKIISRITVYPSYAQSSHGAPFVWATTAGPYFKFYNAPIYELTAGATLTATSFNYTVAFE